MIYDGLMVMKNKWMLLLGIVFCFATVSFAQSRFIHNPVFFAKANRPIEISARIDGGVSSSDEMRVYFRIKGDESYDYVVCEKYGEEFRGNIPAQSISVGKVEYFLTFQHEGNIYTLPESNPYYEPFEIQMTPAGPGNAVTTRQPVPPPPVKKPQSSGNLLSLSADKYLILSPENEEKLTGEDVVIAVSLFFETGEIDIYKTKLLLDGKQVKPELSENLITYVPPRISEGWHEVDLNFIRPDGKEYEPVRWRFQVISARRGGMVTLPLIAKASGNIYAESRSESYSGVHQNNNLIGGQLRGKQGFLRYGTRFYFTSLENKNFQPRNRYLFWLEAKLFNLYVGDTSPRFSELILFGKRVRGFNAQLNLKLINFDFVMGQTYRPVEGTFNQVIIQDSSYFNQATGDTVRNPVSRYGTFGQNLLGLKTTFGSRRGTHLGVSVIKVKDDVNSIQSGLKPKDNVVVGSDIQFTMFNNRFRWRTEGAFSILTNDISNGPDNKEDLESFTGEHYPFNPSDIEKYIIYNTSTVPFDIKNFSSLALTSTLQLQLLRNAFMVKYKSIGAAYNSLGNPFIRKNIRGLFVNDRIRLFRNRVYLNIGYEKYKDNFSQDNGRPILDLQTIQYGFNFFPGSGLPNLNLNFKTYQRNNGVAILDSTFDERENNTTREMTFNVNYDVRLFNLRHNLSVNYIKLDKTDAFQGSRMPMPNFLPVAINNDIQSFSLQTRYQVPLRTTFSYSSNKNSFLGGLNLFDFSSIDARADYNMFREKLNLYAGFRSFNASGGTQTDLPGAAYLGNLVIKYEKTQFDVGARLILKRKHQFIVDLTSIDFKDNGGYYDENNQFVGNPSFKDYMVRFRYELQF